MVKFISRHGIPYSPTKEDLYRLLDITRKRTAAYHPQTDGITERFVSTIKNMIRTYIGENPQDWDQQLDILCFAYNTSTDATTKFSPLFLMTRRETKIPLDLFSKEIIVDLAIEEEDYSKQIEDKLHQAFEVVTKNREYAVNKAKIKHDRQCTAANFKINDYVWRTVKKSVKGTSKALQNKREGPFVVVDLKGDTTCVLKKLRGNSKRETVHKDRLTRCHLRKINENEKCGAVITTTNSQIDSADAQVTAANSQTTTQAKSQPQVTQSQSQRPSLIKRGRKKGSKNKAKTVSNEELNNTQQISSRNSQTVRRSTRLQAKRH